MSTATAKDPAAVLQQVSVELRKLRQQRGEARRQPWRRCHETLRAAACLYDMNAGDMDVPEEYVAKKFQRKLLPSRAELEACILRMAPREQLLREGGCSKQWVLAQERARLHMQERSLQCWIRSTNTTKGHAPGVSATISQWQNLKQSHSLAAGCTVPQQSAQTTRRWLHRWRQKWHVTSGRLKLGENLPRETLRAKAPLIFSSQAASGETGASQKHKKHSPPETKMGTKNDPSFGDYVSKSRKGLEPKASPFWDSIFYFLRHKFLIVSLP